MAKRKVTEWNPTPELISYSAGPYTVQIHRRDGNIRVEVESGGGKAYGLIDISLHDMGWREPQVNWSTSGCQPTGVASMFAKSIIMAETLIVQEYNMIPRSARTKHKA